MFLTIACLREGAAVVLGPRSTRHSTTSEDWHLTSIAHWKGFFEVDILLDTFDDDIFFEIFQKMVFHAW